MACICSFIFAMFCFVHVAGLTPLSTAAFSAGKPKASQPMGWITSKPCNRLNRAKTSLIVNTRWWPKWRLPDGYGNIVRQKKGSALGSTTCLEGWSALLGETLLHREAHFLSSSLRGRVSEDSCNAIAERKNDLAPAIRSSRKFRGVLARQSIGAVDVDLKLNKSHLTKFGVSCIQWLNPR